MPCCTNPKIQSSTYTDWCDNCGWVFSYLTNSEEHDYSIGTEDQDCGDDE